MVGDHPGDGGWPSMAFQLVLISWVLFMCQIPSLLVHFPLVELGWWVTIQGMVADHPWQFTWSWFCESNLCAKFKVCSTLPYGRFWMVVYHPWNGWWPSWGWWLTIHGISTGLKFLSYVYVTNSKPVVHFPLLDLGWWVTLLWMVGDHSGDGGWPSALHLVLILWVKSKCQISSL